MSRKTREVLLDIVDILPPPNRLDREHIESLYFDTESALNCSTSTQSCVDLFCFDAKAKIMQLDLTSECLVVEGKSPKAAITAPTEKSR